MQINKGIIKRISTPETSAEVFRNLIKNGLTDKQWCEVDYNGVPSYIDSDRYIVIDSCIFDVSGAPNVSDNYDDVNDAERLNDTDYRIHAYYYNGGGSLDEMLEESIPKADKEYKEKNKTSKLNIEFPSDKHRDSFTSWLSNSGEQDFFNQADCEHKDDQHLYNVNFNYKSDSLIAVTEFKD